MCVCAWPCVLVHAYLLALIRDLEGGCLCASWMWLSRLSREMQSNPVLEGLRGRGAVLVLDTTYCDPQARGGCAQGLQWQGTLRHVCACAALRHAIRKSKAGRMPVKACESVAIATPRASPACSVSCLNLCKAHSSFDARTLPWSPRLPGPADAVCAFFASAAPSLSPPCCGPLDAIPCPLPLCLLRSQYCFPSQQETLDYTLAAVRSELFNPRALFVFGTYTIGKERLFLEVRWVHGNGHRVSI